MLQISSFPELSLADRLALILSGVGRTAAARLASNRAATPLLLLLWSRLQRAIVRFTRLAAQFDAGRLPRPRLARQQSTRNRAPVLRLPSGFAWLIRLVPEVAALGSQLRHLLGEPEMAALLAAAPQAGRILRPLCRMLAAEPPAVRRPASVTAASPARLEPLAEPRPAAPPDDPPRCAPPRDAAIPG